MSEPSATDWQYTATTYDQRASHYTTVAERVQPHDEEAAQLLHKQAERMRRYAMLARSQASALRDEGV